MASLILAGSSSALALTHVILDASNLQLGLKPGLTGEQLALSSLDVPRLHERHDGLLRLLAGDDAISTTAFFDGSAFQGVYSGSAWDCDPETPDAPPFHVKFTNERVSADDAVVAFAQEVGSEAGSPRAEIISSGHARSMLEQPLPDPRPVFAATLLKSAMGKGKRSKREAFLKTVGLTRMGDTVHLPAFEVLQQDRALALIRGLHSLERGIVRIEQLCEPTAMVISDDRGLRRRCFSLASPPIVLGRKQWENWLLRIPV